MSTCSLTVISAYEEVSKGGEYVTPPPKVEGELLIIYWYPVVEEIGIHIYGMHLYVFYCSCFF